MIRDWTDITHVPVAGTWVDVNDTTMDPAVTSSVTPVGDGVRFTGSGYDSTTWDEVLRLVDQFDVRPGHTYRVGFYYTRHAGSTDLLYLIEPAIELDAAVGVRTKVEWEFTHSGIPGTYGQFLDFWCTDPAPVAYDYTLDGFYARDVTWGEDPQPVKVEVEQDPTGLVNHISNPRGELGGSGWITPVAGSTLSGVKDSFGRLMLKYVSGAAAGGNYWLSEPFPIAATEWAAGRWYVTTATVLGTNTHRVRFDWLTAALAANGSSAWTNYTEDDGTVQLAPKQAPASTAYAQLRIEQATTGGAFPQTAAGQVLWVDEVTVATAATSADLGAIRVNLFPNPSAEVNTTGVVAHGGCTLGRTTTQHTDGGVAAFTVTGDGSAVSEIRNLSGTNGIVVSANRDYTPQFKAKAATVARPTRVRVLWYKSDGTPISSTPAVAGPEDNTTGWTTLTAATFRSPAGAARAAVLVGFTGLAAGEVHYVDEIMLEQASAAGSYFDGSFTDSGTVTYDWTGTAHASTSRRVDTNLAYIEPVTYLDIEGDVAELSITREELNLGTLTAVVTNPLLDPSVENVLQTGRRYRLLAYRPEVAEYEPLILGTLSNAKVDYFPLGKAGRTAKVTLTGTDNVTLLANAKRSDSVGTITELRYVIEGVGVPWNVNGSSQQLASATVVVANDNSTALDQIALARDTERGYAWVDRWGVLQAWTTLTGSPAVTAADPWQLTDDVYNPDIVVDYDTDRTINSVSVLRHWTHPTEGAQGTLYGPYEDAASLAALKRRYHVEVNVAGTDPASIPAYAAAVLAANATPERRCQSVTIPITDIASLAYAFIDLYDAVRVVNAETNLDTVMRVTEVTHRMVSDERHGGRWLVTLGFATEGGIATPTALPPPKGAAGGATQCYLKKTADQTGVASGVGYTAVTFPTTVVNAGGFTIGTNGTRVTIPADGDYDLELSVSWAANTTGRRAVIVSLNDGGTAPTSGAGASVIKGDNRQAVASGATTCKVRTRVVGLVAGDQLAWYGSQTSGAALDINAQNFGVSEVSLTKVA